MIENLNEIPTIHKIALIRIYEEYLEACKQHPNFNSPHEAYAVIFEELDEVWDMIKGTRLPYSNQNRDSMKNEVVAVGAMALRFMIDL